VNGLGVDNVAPDLVVVGPACPLPWRRGSRAKFNCVAWPSGVVRDYSDDVASMDGVREQPERR